MQSPWKFVDCNVVSPNIKCSQTTTDDKRILSVIFDNATSENSPIEIILSLDSPYLSSKTVCIGIRGFSFYSKGFHSLELNSFRRTKIWEKRKPRESNFYIPLRLTAFRNKLVFSLLINSSSAENQLTIDSIDFCSPKPSD